LASHPSPKFTEVQRVLGGKGCSVTNDVLYVPFDGVGTLERLCNDRTSKVEVPKAIQALRAPQDQWVAWTVGTIKDVNTRLERRLGL
jgi:hypothetical protein